MCTPKASVAYAKKDITHGLIFIPMEYVSERRSIRSMPHDNLAEKSKEMPYTKSAHGREARSGYNSQLDIVEKCNDINHFK